MDKQWTEMTPEEKRQKRFRDWLDAHYPQRAEHVMSTINQLRGGNRATKAPAPRWPHAPAAGGKLTALTPVQIEILAFMREYLAENDQLPPVAQVGAKFGMHTNGAQWHLAELGRKGALEKNAAGRWRFARGGAK